MEEKFSEEFPHVHAQHIYKGYLYPNYVLDSSIDALQSFTVRPDDVWVVTYPKSGTHWALEIIGLLRTGGNPEVIDRYASKSCVEMFDVIQKLPLTRQEELDNPVDLSPFLDALARAPSPRVMRTHMHLEALPPTLLDTAKVIYVARNPKDVLTSYYNFTGKSAMTRYTWEIMLDEFLIDQGQYGPWEKHVESFWKARDNKNLLILVYEEMKKDPEGQIRRVAEHLGMPLSDNLLQKVVEGSTVSRMKKTYDNLAFDPTTNTTDGTRFLFVYKGIIGAWKNQFTWRRMRDLINGIKRKWQTRTSVLSFSLNDW